ncbi:flap endonuclease GEN homolog 1 [Carcharodon carcharias]|uniref:flap endonuclease GEN homolog 1 n=1 Tax=Carcharodon carcharias TaxID=13397 RepID=UPI001B7F7600|nr:flap endonuclease GEN homolog 1 [Carcharodon carcharias]
MGVNDLWQILEPVKEYVPLQNLKGKTLAVDMSLWVCEAQTVKGMMGTVIKPHLRNLFFRILCLSLMDVRLVFVAEGNAPKLKADTMHKRNEARRGLPRKPSSFTVRTKRSHFKSVLKECCELLDCLGIPWVCAAGEAEAMCAYLNENGYVDGCITNDGDAFLYGAQIVYRNFTMNTKDSHVDCYKMSAIKSKLGLDRDTLIGFAILLGCDYLPKGVPGVGKEQALRLVETMNGQSLLQRFKLWKLEFEDVATRDTAVEKKAHCSVCRHPGLAREHANKGCRLCASDRCCLRHGNDYLCPCDWHQAEQKRKASLVESNIKKKAKACEHFPFEEVIREFLISKDQLVQNVQWKRPKLLLLQNFALDKMEWPRHYTCEKVLMLLSHHDMMERKLGKRDACHLQPISIVKTRIRNGVPCFEILWGKPEHYIYSNDQSEDSQNTVTTIEDQVPFQAAYPDMTALFHRQKAEEKEKKQKSKSKRKDRIAPLPDEITQLLVEMKLQPSHEGEVSAGSEPVQRSANQEANLSNSSLWNLSIGFSTEDSQVSKEFWGISPNEIAQPAVKLGAEIGKSDCESLSLTESENRFNACSLSPSVSMLVEELHLSSIDWSQSFSTPLSECTAITRAETPEEAHMVINKKCCVPMDSTSKLTEDEALKENTAVSRQDPVRKNMRELVREDASMLDDFYHLPLKDRILLKNSCQFLSLRQSSTNSSGTSFLPCSSGHKNDVSSPKADVECLIQGKLANNITFWNKEGSTGCDFSDTECLQQEQRDVCTSDPTATQHARPLTVLAKRNLMDSMEEVFGTHGPAMYSYQASKMDSISFKLKRNKPAKLHRMKLVNGNASTVQKKSVCYKLSSSSEDSDTENSRMIQKLGVKPRTTENTVMRSCIANHSQLWAQQTQSRSAIGRAGHTRVDAGCTQLKVVSNAGIGTTEQTQSIHQHSKAHSKIVTSQKNTSDAKTEGGSTAVLPRPDLSGVPILKQLSNNDDSIIVISDSPLPLSERLKF